MRRVSRIGIAAMLAAALAGAIGCGGGEDELDVAEGHAVELGDFLYNVQITRFLNPNDREDQAYLADQPAAGADEAYLAVFMTVANEGDSPAELPDEMTIRDTRDNAFHPRESDSVYALPLGDTVPPGEEVPAPGTPAASGPIQGAMVLFRVDRAVQENRPIELEIPSQAGGEEAQVELDI